MPNGKYETGPAGNTKDLTNNYFHPSLACTRNQNEKRFSNTKICLQDMCATLWSRMNDWMKTKKENNNDSKQLNFMHISTLCWGIIKKNMIESRSIGININADANQRPSVWSDITHIWYIKETYVSNGIQWRKKQHQFSLGQAVCVSNEFSNIISQIDEYFSVKLLRIRTFFSISNLNEIAQSFPQNKNQTSNEPNRQNSGHLFRFIVPKKWTARANGYKRKKKNVQAMDYHFQHISI